MSAPSSALGFDGKVTLGISAILVAIAVASPHLLGDRADAMDLSRASEGMSGAHWLGTDSLGRDIFARTLVATRLSLGLAVLAMVFSHLIAYPLGAALAVARPGLRAFGARVLDTTLAFPAILIAIAVTTIVGPSAEGALAAITLAHVPSATRLTYTLAASVAGKDYVVSARSLGIPGSKIVWRHVLPNVGDTLAVTFASGIGVAIIEIAALSFLGLGVSAPSFDWGRMLVEGIDAIYVTPAATLGPAIAIALAGLVFGFAGEAIGRLLNPQRRAPMGAVTAYAPYVLPSVERQRREATPGGAGTPVLVVEDLRVIVASPRGDTVEAVRGVDITVGTGEMVGIVGESGSGKTLTALALAQLMPFPTRATATAFQFMGHDLLSSRRQERTRLLRTKLAMVFQDPMASLNPVVPVGKQLTEGARDHLHLSAREAEDLALARLADVNLSIGRRRLREYPHQFSGGMRQRIMIAMGLVTNPALIIADEPTTALDVTVQCQVLDVLRRISKDNQTALLLISHDLAIISQVCSRVIVMYFGRIVEDCSIEQLLRAPAHPYTQALMRSLPDMNTDTNQPLGAIPGFPATLADPPKGCSFAARCERAMPQCSASEPSLIPLENGHRAACWLASGAIEMTHSSEVPCRA